MNHNLSRPALPGGPLDEARERALAKLATEGPKLRFLPAHDPGRDTFWIERKSPGVTFDPACPIDHVRHPPEKLYIVPIQRLRRKCWFWPWSKLVVDDSKGHGHQLHLSEAAYARMMTRPPIRETFFSKLRAWCRTWM